MAGCIFIQIPRHHVHLYNLLILVLLLVKTASLTGFKEE